MRTGRQSDAGRGVDDIRRLVLRARDADACVASGRHAAAERVWREVAAALERRGAWEASTPVRLMLARHLLERGRAGEAERACADAARLANEAGAPGASASAGLWQAAALTDLGRLSSAEALCRAVLASGHLPVADRVRGVATLVRVLVWQARWDDALAVAEELGRPGCALDAFAIATLVRLHLHCGNVFAAGLRGRAAPAAASDAASLTPIIHTTIDLRLRAATGDVDGVIQTCRRIRGMAAAAHLPLRALRAQVIGLEALKRAGHADAPRLAARIGRFERRVPPLLGRAIAEACGRSGRVTATTCRPSVATARTAVEPGLTSRLAIAIIEASRLASDEAAVDGVLRIIVEGLGADRAEVWRQVGSELRLVAGAGGGPPLSLAPAVVERGAPARLEGVTGHEIGVPIREVDRQLGALAARVTCTQVDAAAEVLAYAAAIVAPRIASLVPERDDSEAARLMPELVGVSEALAELRRAIVKAATAPFAVLVEGESGVGKELVARALHRLGPRRGGPFRDLNCAALPEELLDSELFGHSRGAFTGALADRRGLIEEADGGTLFLDEVADLSARGQAKLLRVLQEREVRRVGEAKGRPVDVRVVSAANRDMRAQAAGGAFRPDLLYRLDVIRLRIPPLRARPDDVVPLAKHFWADASARVGTAAALTREVLEALASHPWPGNVRELQNVIATLAVAAPARGELRLRHLSLHGHDTPSASSRLDDARAGLERRVVREALVRAGGNRAQAARTLGLTRQGLAKLVKRLAIGDVSSAVGPPR